MSRASPSGASAPFCLLVGRPYPLSREETVSGGLGGAFDVLRVTEPELFQLVDPKRSAVILLMATPRRTSTLAAAVEFHPDGSRNPVGGSNGLLLIAALFTPYRSLLVPRGRSLAGRSRRFAQPCKWGCTPPLRYRPLKSVHGSAMIEPAVHGLGRMAVAASISQRELFLLAALELENRLALQPRSTLRPSRLELLTVGIFNRGSSRAASTRAATWCAPLSVACAAPSVTARCRCAPSNDDAPLFFWCWNVRW